MATTTYAPETTSGTVTSWLPLTTPWPLQAGCSSAIWARWGFIANISFDAVAFDPDYGIKVNTASECLPPAATRWWQTLDPSLTAQGVTTRYSIGPLVCPEAYTTVATAVIGDGKTQVACCPSGYDYKSMLNPGIIGECTSPVAKGDVVTYAMLKTQSDDQGGAFTTSTTMTSAYHVLGVPINGVIKGVDVMTSTGMSNGSTMGTSTTMGMGTSATTPAGSAGLYATTSSSSSTPAISSGAKAGIGVGVTAGGIAAIALLSFFLLARRRKQANSSNGFSDSNPDMGEKKVYEKGEGQVPGSPFEVDSSPTYELSG